MDKLGNLTQLENQVGMLNIVKYIHPFWIWRATVSAKFVSWLTQQIFQPFQGGRGTYKIKNSLKSWTTKLIASCKQTHCIMYTFSCITYFTQSYTEFDKSIRSIPKIEIIKLSLVIQRLLFIFSNVLCQWHRILNITRYTKLQI